MKKKEKIIERYHVEEKGYYCTSMAMQKNMDED
jgi:hypothetical protein